MIQMAQMGESLLGPGEEVVERDPRTYAIIGAAMEVHSVLGCGFLEAVYQEALREEFDRVGVPYQKEVGLDIRYAPRFLSSRWRLL